MKELRHAAVRCSAICGSSQQAGVRAKDRLSLRTGFAAPYFFRPLLHALYSQPPVTNTNTKMASPANVQSEPHVLTFARAPAGAG